MESRIVPVAPTVCVEMISDAVEGGTDGVFRFTRYGSTGATLNVNYSVSGSATSGTDFTSIGTTVTFAANSATSDVHVIASSDSVDDPDETVTVTVTSGTGYTVGSPSSAEVDITDLAQNTFTLDSADGEVRYDSRWGQVDPDEATDTVALANFSVIFDGDTFTESNADFTVSPIAEFEYGELIDIKFTVAFSSPVAGLESLVVADGQVTGIDATTHEAGDPATLDNKGPAIMFIDCSTVYFSNAGSYDYTISITYQGERGFTPITVTIPQSDTAGATAQGVRNAIRDALNAAKVAVVTDDPDRSGGFSITAPDGKQLSNVDIYVNLSPKPAGPTVVSRYKGSTETTPTFSFRN